MNAGKDFRAKNEIIRFPDRKLTWHFEQSLRQTRQLSQSANFSEDDAGGLCGVASGDRISCPPD